MQLEDYFEFVAPDDIRIRGHRISVESVVYAYAHRGLTAEQIAREFDTLTLEQVYATILYYLRNKPELDRLLADWLAGFRNDREEQRLQHPEFVEKVEARKQKAAHQARR